MKFDHLFDSIFPCINELMHTTEMVNLGVQIRSKMLKVSCRFNFCCYNVSNNLKIVCSGTLSKITKI